MERKSNFLKSVFVAVAEPRSPTLSTLLRAAQLTALHLQISRNITYIAAKFAPIYLCRKLVDPLAVDNEKYSDFVIVSEKVDKILKISTKFNWIQMEIIWYIFDSVRIAPISRYRREKVYIWFFFLIL